MFITQIERQIQDFREIGFPDFFRRDCPLNQVPGTVSVVIGARRSGKSYRTLQEASDLVASGAIPSIRHICPVDFDNPHLSVMKATDLAAIQTSFYKLNPGFDLHVPVLFVLDEIHKIPGWENYVVDLSRNRSWKVVVTGSSSRMLRDDIATELRGKSISTVVYPLSFREFLRFNGVDRPAESTSGQAAVARLFEQYLRRGGYPAVTMAEERLKEALLREYFDVMILRDIIQRYEISQPRECALVLRHLLSNIAKPFTIKSCLEFARIGGHALGWQTVARWVGHAADSWLLFAVPIFTSSTKEEERNFRKLYCIDWALANCNSLVWDGGLSRALENMVFLHLHRRWSNVRYYLTKARRQEVDFVCVDGNGKIGLLVQVCQDMSDPVTQRREIEPLVAAARFFGCADCVVVTGREERMIEEAGIGIRVVPAARWLLES